MIEIRTTAANPIQKFIAIVVGLGVLVLAFLFSVALLPVILIAGVIAFGYFYWKTRVLRQAINASLNPANKTEHEIVIEGEATVVREADRSLPKLPLR